MQALTVVIITYNEEKNIGRCISSVRKLADEIIVMDSFSDDGTVNIAVSMGAHVKQSKFDGYINQKNKAIGLATNNYVLLLDADEQLSDELAASVLQAKESFDFKAYSMKRCNVFCGKYIKHGLWYPDKKLRLFDKRYGKCGGFNPHDKIIMEEGTEVMLLNGDMLHYTFDTIAEYRKRNDEVSTVAAQSLYEAGVKSSWLKIIFSPLWAFVNGYFFRRGFSEGYNGFIIAIFTARQSYLKHQKLRQLHRQDITEVAWE